MLQYTLIDMECAIVGCKEAPVCKLLVFSSIPDLGQGLPEIYCRQHGQDQRAASEAWAKAHKLLWEEKKPIQSVTKE